MPRRRDAGRPRRARWDAVPGAWRRGPLDAATEAALLDRLTGARGALLKAATRLPEIQAACLRSCDSWIHTGRVTRSAHRSFLIGVEGRGSLRTRLRVLHSRAGCPARPRAQAANVATLSAAFAALPLRAAWLIGQLARVPDTPNLGPARAAAEEWVAARNALVETLHGFVVTLARRAPTWHVPLEDRIQVGVLALTFAIEGFDTARGMRLTTYVGRVLERAMRRLARATPPTAALPSFGLSTSQPASPAASHWVTLVTIDAAKDDDGLGRLTDRLVDPGVPTPEDLAILAVDGARVRSQLACLEPRQREILKLLFGLDGLQARDLRGAGAVVGLSAATVRRVRDRALAHLTRAVTGTGTAARPTSSPFQETSHEMSSPKLGRHDQQP